MGYKRKYTKLQNRLWEEVHREHRVVFASKLDYEALIDLVTLRFAEFCPEGKIDLRDAVELILGDLLLLSDLEG
jgi:hypothetical protein